MDYFFPQILLSITIFQFLFISIYLIGARQSKIIYPNRILAIFFLMLVIALIDMLLSSIGLYVHYSNFALLDDSFFLAYGPLIYFYVKFSINPEMKFNMTFFYNFIPFTLMTLLLLFSQLLMNDSENSLLIEQVNSFSLPLIYTYIIVGFYAHILFYLLLSFKTFREERERLKNHLSSAKFIEMDWLDFLLKTLLVIMLMGIFLTIIPYTSYQDWLELILFLFVLFIFYFINRVIFKALNQPRLFSGSIEIEKYSQSLLTEDEAEKIAKKLNILIDDHIYLQTDLTIDQISEKIAVHPKKVSQVINQVYKQNFFDYINTNRIQYAMNLFKNNNDDKLTILEVLYQSGFQSKSSFNSYFKKVTGETPSEYRKK